MPITPSNPSPCRRRTASGFTLTELLVAVGAVVLLTVGIGQVFRQVSKLVGTGTAVAETDQLARAIERQLRDDFSSLSRFGSDQTYIAIRNRRLGDIDRSESVNGNERPLYIRLDDRQDEIRGSITNPYGPDGRGVTVRLDEISFLAFAGDARRFVSFQQAEGLGTQPVESAVARIQYGHGLRPGLDPDFDASRPVGQVGGTGPINFPRRQLRADQANLNDPWGRAFGAPRSRNEFAGDFMLLRQSMMLYGGLAAGYVGSGGGGGTPDRAPPIGERRKFAPFIRDAENFDRIGDIINTPPGGPAVLSNRSLPRAARHGRADICAQTPEDVRRWLEGLAPAPSSGPAVAQPDATAFDSGFFNSTALLNVALNPDQGLTGNSPDRPLYRRVVLNSPVPGQNRQQNLRLLRSAIAGCMTRILAESEPPPVSRNRAWTSDDPQDSLMDLHAVLASRCSSFEVAWSDGTTWRGPNGAGSQPLRIDLGAGQEIVYNVGDIIWFDIDFPRRMLELGQFGGPAYAPLTDVRPEALSNVSRPNNATPPVDSRRTNQLILDPSIRGAYDEELSGGDEDEYVAVWGFREPDDAGGYAGAWAKPRLIRIRMTIHDSQFRIAGGRRYEFIFSVDTK